MVELRSCKTGSVPIQPQSQTKTPPGPLGKSAPEPSTPAKIHETRIIQSFHSPGTPSAGTENQSRGSDGSMSPSFNGLDFHLASVPEAPRRSLRIASKVVTGDGCGTLSSSVSSRRGRRKITVLKNGKFDSRNVDEESVGKINVIRNDSVSDVGEERAWVSEFNFGVDDDQKICLSRTGMGSGEGEAIVEDDGINGNATSWGKVNGKRMFDRGITQSFSELDNEDGGNTFLSLRSGKRLVKRKISSGKIINGVNDERMLSRESSEKNPIGGQSAYIMTSRRLSVERKGKDKMVDNGLTIDFGKMDLLSAARNQTDDVDEGCGSVGNGMKFSSGEKGEWKVAGDASLFSGNNLVEKGPEAMAGKLIIDKYNGHGHDKSRRRFSKEEKGKGKLAEDSMVSHGINLVDLNMEEENANDSVGNNVALQSDLTPGNMALPDGEKLSETKTRGSESRRKGRIGKFRDIAKQNASRFARFSFEEDQEGHMVSEAEEEVPSHEVGQEIEDWPGPFATAMKIIRNRGMSQNVQPGKSFSNQNAYKNVSWIPSKSLSYKPEKPLVPSLQAICMQILAKNVDAITSLDHVPDVIRHKLSHVLCDSRRMNHHFLNLLLSGSPTELRIRDCSWLTEEQFIKSFEGCDASNLMVLQLDQCGRSMPDYVLLSTLGRSANSLPALVTLSLKGACRLSDAGLGSLVSSAPALRSINLSQCSLLTSSGISSLCDSLQSVLRELYIDDCQNIDPMLVLPALKKVERLEVLSLAGISTVTDAFVNELMVVRGCAMKELTLTDCVKLTDSSLKVIAENCPGLCALDLRNLQKLTDSAIGYLANGSVTIRKLKLCRNAFSDEAIAAFLETSGDNLEELSLNNLKTGENTAIALARRCKKLHTLDLSWCRNLTDAALGLIVDSCLSLDVLKLFGCTQLTNVFLDGHSNSRVEIIGLKMTPLLKHLKVPDFQGGPLLYSTVQS